MFVIRYFIYLLMFDGFACVLGQLSIYCEEHGIWRLSHSWICYDETQLYPSVLCWNDEVLAMVFWHIHNDNKNVLRLWRSEGIERPCVQVGIIMIDDCVQGIIWRIWNAAL